MPLPQRRYSNTANAKVSCVSHSGVETKAWGKKAKKPTNQRKPKKKTNHEKNPKPPQLSTTRKIPERTH